MSAAAEDGATATAKEHAREQGLVVERTPEATRRLALLWEQRPEHTRGRRPRLSVDEVVDAGIAVALQDGLDALSMRRVASRLGVGAMSLYTYVPGRTELVDLMIDRAHADLDLPDGTEAWRAGLRRYAHGFWELYHAHPWLLQTNLWRAPLAPHVLEAQEAGLRTIVDAGLTAEQVVETLAVVDSFVQGLARTDIAEQLERERTGQDIEAYWTSLSSFWEDHFDIERFPTMTRLYVAGGFDHVQEGIEGPLERLLDSIGLAIDGAATA